MFPRIYSHIHHKKLLFTGCLIAACCFLFLLLAHQAYTYLINPNAPVISQEEENTAFLEFTKNLFTEEVSANTLTLHYTLRDPSAYGIAEPDITLGNYVPGSAGTKGAALSETMAQLHSFSYEELNTENRLTYDIMDAQLSAELEAAPYGLYEEIFGPTLGTQAQLPILLAEYPLKTLEDVDIYLELLSQIGPYYESLLVFEQEKSEAGLFMWEDTAKAVIQQCQDFIQNPEENFLITTFEDRISSLPFLSLQQKQAYLESNKKCVLNSVIPAYKRLIAGLTALKSTGHNSKGLCYFEEGKEYYEALVSCTIGSSRSVQEIEALLEERMNTDFEIISDILQGNPKLIQETASVDIQLDETAASELASDTLPSDEIYQTAFVELPDEASELSTASESSAVQSSSEESSAVQNSSEQSASAANSPVLEAPSQMLKSLEQKIIEDFPKVPSTEYQVKSVHPSLEQYLSPAFYLTPPIDAAENHTIYINGASNYDSISLFTTLAHEGYPGHLYQNLYEIACEPDPIRSLFNFGGYTEGWATYAERCSYAYTGLEPELAELLAANNAISLGIYAKADIGIHYHGWTLDETADYLKTFGIESQETAQNIYQAILEAPANYLKYYLGYVEIEKLKERAQTALKDNFDLKEFHEFVLSTGPAPFSVLNQYLELWIQERS